ncbi:MAG: YlxR family protein [Thermodesulfobacteriota bacterium]
MRRGHTPIRQCVGCRRRRPKSELIRLKSLQQTVVVSPTDDKTPGRGCYMCPDNSCAEKALRKGRLEKALRTTITVSPSKEAVFAGL